MQLSKPFNFDENSIFTDHVIRDQHLSSSSPSPRHQSIGNEGILNPEGTSCSQDCSNQIRFFQEFKKIYNVSYHLYLQKLRFADLHKQLTRRINTIQERLQMKEEKEPKRAETSSQQNKMKRSRRTAEMIEKKFKCNVAFCERLYGTEGSLQQHIKLKHPELFHSFDTGSLLVSEECNDSI